MGRPRSPNPTITVAYRITKTLDDKIEQMAAAKGTTKSALMSRWVAQGYNGELVSESVN